MNAAAIIERLAPFPGALAAAVRAFPDSDLRWKPSETDWSVLEVAVHVLDEETRDFRARLAHVLEQRGGAWRPIDPPKWARDERYHERDPEQVLAAFARERAASVAWLRSLRTPDWSLAYHHPKFGPIPAGDLLASWSAHDFLHLRQIARRGWQLSQGNAPEFSVQYAGER